MAGIKLYELTDDFLKVSEMLESGESEDFQLIRDTLEGIEGEITYKAESIAKLIRSMDLEGEAIKLEEKRLHKRRCALNNNITGLKHYLKTQFEKSGIKRVNGNIFKISLQNNPPGVSVKEGAKLPGKYYVKQPLILSKTLVLEDLKNGKKIKYAEMYQGQSIRIR